MIRIMEEIERLNNAPTEIEKLVADGFTHAEIVSHLLVKGYLTKFALDADEGLDYSIDTDNKAGVLTFSKIQDELDCIRKHIVTLENKISKLKK